MANLSTCSRHMTKILLSSSTHYMCTTGHESPLRGRFSSQSAWAQCELDPPHVFQGLPTICDLQVSLQFLDVSKQVANLHQPKQGEHAQVGLQLNEHIYLWCLNTIEAFLSCPKFPYTNTHEDLYNATHNAVSFAKYWLSTVESTGQENQNAFLCKVNKLLLIYFKTFCGFSLIDYHQLRVSYHGRTFY